MRKLLSALWAITLLVACDSESTFNSSNKAGISNVNIDVIDTTHRYEIHLTYPQIDGDISANAQQQINTVITESFLQLANQKEFVDSHESLSDTLFSSKDWSGHLSNTFQAFQYDSIITIHFTVHQFYLGAAHGNSQNKTLHFSSNSGRLLTFENFFKTDSNSLLTLKNEINHTLSDSICWGIESDTDLIENLSNFIIQPDSVTFKFNDYDLCPYALGVTEIKLSNQQAANALLPFSTGSFTELIAPQATGEIATH